MNDVSSDPLDVFLATAVRHDMLTKSQADDVHEQAADRDISVADVVLENGLLSPTHVDIVRALTTPNQVAPGFEIQGVLGHGGLGIVYRAMQPKLGRLVALKTIPLARTNQQGVMARFQQEAQVIGRLHHPQIVSAFDYGTHAGRLFLAMELVDGTDLETKIEREGALPPTVCWGIVRQVAAGLAHAAKEGVVHRDIKPANLLLTDPPAGHALPDGVPMTKITDFGLARLVTEDDNQTRLTMLGSTLGTPQYMAPEQLVAAEVDLRADVYALGATAFHMLSGTAPFGDATTGQILAMKARGETLLLSELPGGSTTASARLIADMTAPEPEQRLGDYQTLLERVDQLIENPATETDHETLTHSAPTVGAMPVSSPSVANPSVATGQNRAAQVPTSSRRRVLIGGVVATVCLCVMLVWAMWSGTNSPTEPRFVRTDWQRPLSDGKTLTVWKMRGQWSYLKNEEDASVLTGNGRIERPLPNVDFPTVRPLPNYGISLGVNLNDATEVELQFWDNGSLENSVHVLQLSDQGAALGSRADGADIRLTSHRISPSNRSTSSMAAYRELRVERHGAYWLAFFDGQLVGNVPTTGTAGAKAIRISVTGGTAHFDEIYVFELVPDKRDT